MVQFTHESHQLSILFPAIENASLEYNNSDHWHTFGQTSDRFCYKFFKIAYHCCMCIVNSNLNLLDIDPTFNFSNENTNLSLRT